MIMMTIMIITRRVAVVPVTTAMYAEAYSKTGSPVSFRIPSRIRRRGSAFAYADARMLATALQQQEAILGSVILSPLWYGSRPNTVFRLRVF